MFTVPFFNESFESLSDVANRCCDSCDSGGDWSGSGKLVVEAGGARFSVPFADIVAAANNWEVANLLLEALAFRVGGRLQSAPVFVQESAEAAHANCDLDTQAVCLVAALGDEAAIKEVESWRVNE